MILGGCGDIHQPYRLLSVEEKLANPLLQQADAYGIVLDIQGHEFDNHALSFITALESALEEYQIPVRHATSTTERVIVDQVTGQYQKTKTEISFIWQFSRNNEVNNSQIPISQEFSLENFNQALAEHVAREIAVILKPETMEALKKEDELQNISIHLAPIFGAPGDGNETLHRHITSLFRKTGLKIATSSTTAFFTLKGAVAISRKNQKQERVSLEWVLRDKNEREIKKIRQSNIIKAGAFNQHWGDAAYWIAAGVVQETAKEIDKIVYSGKNN